MVDAILTAINSSFQKGIASCRSIYVKKVMKLLAFIFEQPSYKEKGSLAHLEENLKLSHGGPGQRQATDSSFTSIIIESRA